MHVYFRELFVPHNAKKQTFAIVLHKKEELKKKKKERRSICLACRPTCRYPKRENFRVFSDSRKLECVICIEA